MLGSPLLRRVSSWRRGGSCDIDRRDNRDIEIMIAMHPNNVLILPGHITSTKSHIFLENEPMMKWLLLLKLMVAVMMTDNEL